MTCVQISLNRSTDCAYAGAGEQGDQLAADCQEARDGLLGPRQGGRTIIDSVEISINSQSGACMTSVPGPG
eukprot:COSAG02_NODE_684_length_18490_cov_14.283019_13_plen_71_part_00